MRRKSLPQEILCGLLLGALLIPPAQPVQAQWPVSDIGAYTQRMRSELQRIREWVDRIQRDTAMYTTIVHQLTTLRGMLQTVDKALAKDDETAMLTMDIADILQGSHMLYNQVKSMVRYQVASLQQIDDRLSNGIFDPDKDRADLEEYLLYSMGRNSRQTVRLMVETANADVFIQTWMKEKQDMEMQLAKANRDLKALRDRAKNSRRSDPSNTQALNEAIQRTEALIFSLKKSIAGLNKEITQRAINYGVRLSDMENFAYAIESTKAAWVELNITKDSIANTFDASILQMKPEP
jgi:septal ring factor EnvC (AmiA/AmiB activator)